MVFVFFKQLKKLPVFALFFQKPQSFLGIFHMFPCPCYEVMDALSGDLQRFSRFGEREILQKDHLTGESLFLSYQSSVDIKQKSVPDTLVKRIRILQNITPVLMNQ